MNTYFGYKVVAQDKESLVAYGPQVLGVWKGCPNPQDFLQPSPKITKKDKMTIADTNPIINMVLENPNLKEGETKRMRLLIGEHPSEDKLVYTF